MRFCQHANRGVDGGEYGTRQEYDEFDGEEVIFWFSGVTEAGVGVRRGNVEGGCEGCSTARGVFRCMLFYILLSSPPHLQCIHWR